MGWYEDTLVLTEDETYAGWKKADKAYLEIGVSSAATFFHLGTWDTNYFLQEMYVKEIDGYYFAWFFNTVGLSDNGGGRTNETANRIAWQNAAGTWYAHSFLY